MTRTVGGQTRAGSCTTIPARPPTGSPGSSSCYAQKLNVIAALTTQHVLHEDGRTLLRLGSRPIVLPVPLDALAGALVADRKVPGTSLLSVPSSWLFPGAGAAQRAAGALPTAEPFTRTTRRRVPAPPLRVGIACDQSASMGTYTGPVASAAWILARPTASIPAATTRAANAGAALVYGSAEVSAYRNGAVRCVLTRS